MKVRLSPMFFIFSVFEPDDVDNQYLDGLIGRGYPHNFSRMRARDLLSGADEVVLRYLIKDLHFAIREAFP